MFGHMPGRNKDMDNEICTTIHSGCFKAFVFGNMPGKSASIDVML